MDVSELSPEQRKRLELECASQARRNDATRQVLVRLAVRALLGWLVVTAVGAACVYRATKADMEASPSVNAPAEAPPETWATDGDAEALARPMPATPFKEQARPPCAAEHVPLNGGCWEELARRPKGGTCGSSAFEHAGRCYIPVKQAKRPPTSVEP